MRKSDLLILPVLGLMVAAGGCKNRSGSGSGSTGGGATGGGGTVTLTFAGPIEATPTQGDEVAISWAIATNSANDAPSSMRYSVYRGTQRDMSDEQLILDQAAQNALLDSGLLDDITYYYRVVAFDPAGNRSEDTGLVSAHLPRIPLPPIDYGTEVGPLWSTVVARDGKTVCIDCHNDAQPYGFLSLESWERLMIGRGTPEKPDGFIYEGDAKRTGAEFLKLYFDEENPVQAHRAWRFKREFFLPEVELWIDEGALEVPDTTRPTFDFADLQNKARYSATDNGDGTVYVNFPHAYDPESEPIRDRLDDHLEYHVYGGPDSASIDFRNPVAIVNRYFFDKELETYGVRFPWAFETGVFVVRAYDYTGNATLNEREVSLID